MLTYFAVTFGTSDVQFEKSRLGNSGLELITEKSGDRDIIHLRQKGQKGLNICLKPNRERVEWFLTSSPRVDGETILRNMAELEPVISFPLIFPVIDKIISQDGKIDKFLLVYTDQKDAHERHRNNDSVHFAAIFRELIRKRFPSLNEEDFIMFPLSEKVTDIDYQYAGFEKACGSVLGVPPAEVKEVILLPQGGIDQVNQAITLRFIQAFGGKLKLYQQAEDNEPRLLRFTHLFLFDLIRQQLASLIREADYQGAEMIARSHSEEQLKALVPFLEFAKYRKLFLFLEAGKVAGRIGSKAPAFMTAYCQRNNLPLKLLSEITDREAVFMISERFYLADFYFAQKNYTDFILSLQIFYETLAGLYLGGIYGINLGKKHFESVTQLIGLICKNEPEIYGNACRLLNLYEDQKLEVSFPTLAALALQVSEKRSHQTVRSLLDPLLHINSMLNGFAGSCGLDRLRNMIAHEGKGVVEQDLYVASNLKDKKDKMKYWNDLFVSLHMELEIHENPYRMMGNFILEKLNA